MSYQNKLIAVACNNEFGEAEMILVDVESSDMKGAHYDSALIKARALGYCPPFICFDQQEQGSIHKAVKTLSSPAKKISKIDMLRIEITREEMDIILRELASFVKPQTVDNWMFNASSIGPEPADILEDIINVPTSLFIGKFVLFLVK